MRLDPRAPSIYSNVVSVACLIVSAFASRSMAQMVLASIEKEYLDRPLPQLTEILIRGQVQSPGLLIGFVVIAFGLATATVLLSVRQRNPWRDAGLSFVGAAGFIASILLLWLTIFAAVMPFFQLTGAKS